MSKMWQALNLFKMFQRKPRHSPQRTLNKENIVDLSIPTNGMYSIMYRNKKYSEMHPNWDTGTKALFMVDLMDGRIFIYSYKSLGRAINGSFFR